MTIVAIIAGVCAAYCVGTIPFSVYIARLAGHNLYETGSGNPGASNVARVAGWRWGVAAMALDIAKGLIPAALALVLAHQHLTNEQSRVVGYAVATAAILGHTFPIVRKGGKGIATGGGAGLALFAVAGALAIVTWIIVMKITKLPVISSIVAAAVLPTWVLLDHHYYRWETLVVTALFAFVVIRHIPNIRRMARREESGVTKDGRSQYNQVMDQ